MATDDTDKNGAEESPSEHEQEESSEKKESSSEDGKKAAKASSEKKKEEPKKEKPKKKEEPKPAPRKPWVNFFPPKKVEHRPPEIIEEKTPVLLLAEFDSPARLLHAAERVRDAGYSKWDVHSPFPIHGMDGAMGLPDSKLGWIVLVGGLTGVSTAVAMIFWMNGVDYPLIVGGKPPFSLPPSVPIMFELTVLFSSFAAVLGMFHLNRIPQHYHPIFTSDRFRGCSDDKFFLSVEVGDPKYHAERTKSLLEKAHATHVELIEETSTKVISHHEEHE